MIDYLSETAYDITGILVATYRCVGSFSKFTNARLCMLEQFSSKRFAPVISGEILVSGLMFSLYHLGYPGFRAFGGIALLLAVGVGFATTYKLSGDNLVVAYFVNLPNAFVTYILKHEQFPVIEISSTIASSITLSILIVVFIALTGVKKKAPKGRRASK